MESTLAAHVEFGGMVGLSKAARDLFAQLQQAATSDATVLLQGETGTGKEASAEAIHRRSRRKDGPFVVVDCGAIPPALLESELFGHEKGSFTGAIEARQGAFEAAHKGTIVLDEMGELATLLQTKILRALDRKEIKRVGATAYKPVDVRVVASTNRNLRAEVKAKRFRADLYYRLAVVTIDVPPLRDRLEDVPLLVESMLAQIGAADSPHAKVLLSRDVIKKLQSHDWPGNIRQLRNYIARSIALDDPGLPPAEQFVPTTALSVPPRAAKSKGADAAAVYDLPWKDARAATVVAFERQYLETKLALYGSIEAAAVASGLDSEQFYRLMWKHGIRVGKDPRVK